MPLDSLDVATVIIDVRIAEVQQTDSAGNLDTNRDKF
jgi:hypothetical protein